MQENLPPEVTVAKESRVLFERIAAISDAMMFITDLATHSTLWVNDRLVELTGYTFEDYQFQRFQNPFIPAEDLERVGQFLGDFLASEEVVSSGTVQNRFVDRWGGTLHVITRMAKVDWLGSPALLYSTMLTESETTQSEEVELRYRSLVESATDSIVRLRQDTTFHYSNLCFQKLIGMAPVVLNTRSFVELVVESHRERVAAALASLGAGKDKVVVTAPLVIASGADESSPEVVWLEGTFVRIKAGLDAGKLQAILRDTTMQRRLDVALAQAHKSETLAQMAGGIAHDLNNILTGLMGSASLAQYLVTPGSEAAQAVSIILLAATRAGELSSSMLAYAGEGNAERVPVNLSELVAEMNPLLGSAVGREVTLVIDVSSTNVLVEADETQLRQVVMNLITNAADATRSNVGGGLRGRSEVLVRVGTRVLESHFAHGDFVFGTPPPPGQQVAFVTVSDDGVGMAADTITRIFDPFFTTKAKGRGLGLAAVIGILGRHDGCIRVNSHVGRGTRMEVVLPLLPQEERSIAQPAELTPSGLATILVVDDEPMARAFVRQAFQAQGATVLEAESGEEAIGILGTSGGQISLVVLDQTMPGMGGDRTLLAIRETLPTLPVVRTSGYLADPILAQRDEYTVCLGKPYGIRQLTDAVNGLFRHTQR